jgi:hypothetical protein
MKMNWNEMLKKKKLVFGALMFVLIFILIFILLISGYLQQPLIQKLESGKTMLLMAPAKATFDSPSLANNFLFWADTRAGMNRTCNQWTCNYNVYTINLKTGEEIEVATTDFSDIKVLTDGEAVVWEEKHPFRCIDGNDDITTCEHFEKIWAAPVENLTDKEEVYVLNATGSFITNKYVYRDWLVLERYHPDYFNYLELVFLDTGEIIELPTQKARPGSTYGMKSDPVISGKGTVWFTSWGFWGGEITSETLGYDIEKRRVVKLLPPEGFGEFQGAIHLSRSEDGIIWVHGRKGAWEVWQYDEEASKYEKIYETERFLRHPVLRGNILLYVIKESGYDELYAYNLLTKEEKQLTNEKKLILGVQYDEPYLAWTIWGRGLDIRFRKWTWGE